MTARVMPLGLTSEQAVLWQACTSKRAYTTLEAAAAAAKHTGPGIAPYRCKRVFPAHWHVGHWRERAK